MKTISLYLALCVALFSSGCGGMFKGKQAAEQGVADFHKLYNDGKVTDIYSTAHSKFQEVPSNKEQFTDLMSAVRRKLGNVTQSTEAGFNVSTINLTTTVVLTQYTTFERGSGTEDFTFEMDGDKALLVRYNINSKDMMLK